MSKRQSTNYNKFDRVRNTIFSVYRMAKTYQHSFEDLMKDQKKYLEHPDRHGLPQYYMGNLQGVANTLFNDLQTNQVEWMHYYTNRVGRIVYVNDWDDLPDYIKDNGNFHGNHFWKNPKKNDQGQLVHRPFGVNPSTGTGRN